MHFKHYNTIVRKTAHIHQLMGAKYPLNINKHAELNWGTPTCDKRSKYI